MATDPSPALTLRHKTWNSLLPHAHPDSRHNYDFSLFTPDFKSSDTAIQRLCDLPCYQNAKTLYVGSDNCLTGLRAQALRDGKTVLVPTVGFKRGFCILEPRRICPIKANEEWRFEIAALLDGMERPGFGRRINLAQMKDEGLKVEVCVTGSVAVFPDTGKRLGSGDGLFDVCWGLMWDVGVIGAQTSVVSVVHDVQIVERTGYNGEELDNIEQEPWDTSLDVIVTPTKVVTVNGTKKPEIGISWERLEKGMLDAMPRLQELKGIQLMQKIMGMGLRDEERGSKVEEDKGKEIPNEHEMMGISIVERLMRGYKA